MIDDILRPGEYVGMKQAVAYIRVQERALRRWYQDEPRLGRRCLAGGKIELSLPALLMYRTGNDQALDLYAAGERDHAAVRPFIEAVAAELTKAKPSATACDRLWQLPRRLRTWSSPINGDDHHCS